MWTLAALCAASAEAHARPLPPIPTQGQDYDDDEGYDFDDDGGDDVPASYM